MNKKTSLSLDNLMRVLAQQTNDKPYVPIPGIVAKQTTIKLEPEVKEFCEDYANLLGVSFVSFIGMVMKGTMLATTNPAKSETTIIAERFFEIFNAHGIPNIDIPEFLSKFNFPLSVLSEKPILLNHISNEVLLFMAKRFKVDVEWLRGISDRPSPYLTTWYKNVLHFCKKIASYKKSGFNPSVSIIKVEDFDMNFKGDNSDDSNIIVSIEWKEEYSEQGKTFKRCEIYDVEPWCYQKCRLQAKAIILFCYICRIPCNGYIVDGRKGQNYYQIPTKELKELTKKNTWEPFDYINFHDSENTTCLQKEELNFVYHHFFHFGMLDEICQDIFDNALVLPFENYKKGFLEKIQEIHKKNNCDYLRL